MKSEREYILKSIPDEEKKTYDTLSALPKNEKRLIWQLIRESNIEGITMYKRNPKTLNYLRSQGLIAINPLYKSSNHEVSVFVLRNSPYLQRLLRKMARRGEK
ncbi:hypothetical protein [Oceanobacillus salinisoli]|uniref:hypothetical protein n=1 Tax=Oceanobacillus salinisoli TaxID=2678611 RepID=UPI0012E3255F|nr:hypothetical protein [Oceanobacillus salinisoli]